MCLKGCFILSFRSVGATNYWKQKTHLDWNKDGIKSMTNKRKHDATESSEK